MARQVPRGGAPPYQQGYDGRRTSNDYGKDYEVYPSRTGRRESGRNDYDENYDDRRRPPPGNRAYPEEYDGRRINPSNPYAGKPPLQREPYPEPPLGGYGPQRGPRSDPYYQPRQRPRGSIDNSGLAEPMGNLRVAPRPTEPVGPQRQRYADPPPNQRPEWEQRRPSQGYPRDQRYRENSPPPPRSVAARPPARAGPPPRQEYDERLDYPRAPADPRRGGYPNEYDDRRGSNFSPQPPRRLGAPSSRAPSHEQYYGPQ